MQPCVVAGLTVSARKYMHLNKYIRVCNVHILTIQHYTVETLYIAFYKLIKCMACIAIGPTQRTLRMSNNFDDVDVVRIGP